MMIKLLKKWQVFAIAFFVLLAAAGLYLATGKTVQVVEDGKTTEIYTHAFTVGGALSSAGFSFSDQDALQPAKNGFLRRGAAITLDHARPVTLASPALGGSLTFTSAERIPAKLAAQVGLGLTSADRILWNGVQFPLDHALPPAPAYTLQVIKASAVQVTEGGQTTLIESSAPSAGAALWQAGIVLSESDHLSVPPESPMPEDGALQLARSIPITIQAGGIEIHSRSSAATAGGALAEAGVSLQGLDYSIPAEDQPLPPDGILQVVRVNEQVDLEQTAIPFESEFVENPEVELDQRSVVEAGQYGIEVTRVRVRYENGQEVSRQDDSQWVAVEPKTEKIGYGTKIVIHTLDTPNGPIEYWRAVPVYATAYSPCRSGTTKCYSGTSSGRPVQRGVIGVTRQWYSLFANQPVYVPGYGTAVIGDVGGGIPGKYWIDLAFTDEDFEAWHQDTILYFLTPVPATVPWILP